MLAFHVLVTLTDTKSPQDITIARRHCLMTGPRIAFSLCAALLLLVTAACRQSPPPASGLGNDTIVDPNASKPAAAQLLLINQGSLPGFYAVCYLDGEILPYKLSADQYIERQLLRAGLHRVECAVETLSLQVSFDCDHEFQVYADEPIYLSLTGRALPGTCRIKRLSILPADFHREYTHANESLLE